MDQEGVKSVEPYCNTPRPAMQEPGINQDVLMFVVILECRVARTARRRSLHPVIRLFIQVISQSGITRIFAFFLDWNGVDFSSHDEVVFTQAADCMCGHLNAYRSISGQMQVRMMPLIFCQTGYGVKKSDCLHKILGDPFSCDFYGRFVNRPAGNLIQQVSALFACQARDCALAGNTSSFVQSDDWRNHGCNLPLKSAGKFPSLNCLGHLSIHCNRMRTDPCGTTCK